MLIRVCIADAHRLTLAGVKSALDAAEEIDVVGVTHSGDEVLPLVHELRPDLLLLDTRMPGVDGVECVGLVRRSCPDTRVIVLAASEDVAEIAAALAAGATAYIGKRINPGDLASALRQIVAGVVYHAIPVIDQAHGVVDRAPAAARGATVADPTLDDAAADAGRPHADLTPRELTVLRAISDGHSTKVISRELWVSEKTVKFHLTNVYRKLGVHNRTGAMRYAFEHGLIEQTPPAAVAAASAAA